jgi:hypothetical protein
MSDEYSTTVAKLTAWFRERLDQLDLRLDGEALSYDSNTAYDRTFYKLQEEAAQHWQRVHGFTPTPGQLAKAFFAAEFERFRAHRLASRGNVIKLKDWLRSKRRAR